MPRADREPADRPPARRHRRPARAARPARRADGDRRFRDRLLLAAQPQAAAGRTTSRSTAPSSAGSAATRTARRSSAPRSSSRAAWASSWSPRAWRPRPSGATSAASAATASRATSTPSRSRQRPSAGWRWPRCGPGRAGPSAPIQEPARRLRGRGAHALGRRAALARPARDRALHPEHRAHAGVEPRVDVGQILVRQVLEPAAAAPRPAGPRAPPRRARRGTARPWSAPASRRGRSRS